MRESEYNKPAEFVQRTEYLKKVAQVRANHASLESRSAHGNSQHLVPPASTPDVVSCDQIRLALTFWSVTTVGETTSNSAGSNASQEIDISFDDYLAPLIPTYEVPLYPNHYNVHILKGYTSEQHSKFLGGNCKATDNRGWYEASLTAEELYRVRCDPGIAKVTKTGSAVWN